MKKRLLHNIEAFINNRKLVVASILSLILVFWIRETSLPFTINVTKITNGRKDLIIYHDFDHDGNSEKINIEFHFPTDNYFMYIFDSDGKQRYKIEIGKWQTFRYRYYFGDFNGDDVDELYLLDKEKNQLILIVYDFNNNIILINKPIVRYKKIRINSHIPIPYTAKFLGLDDVDKDGEKEAIIFYNQIDQFLDSKLIAVDLRTGSVKEESPVFKYYFGKAELVNLDNDPQKEIILYPRRIYNSEKPFIRPSYKNYLIILDDNFKVIFSHKFASGFKNRSVRLFFHNGKPLFMETAVKTHRGKEDFLFQVINLKGETIYTHTFENAKMVNGPHILFSSKMLLCFTEVSDEFTQFRIYEYPLKLVKTINIKGLGYKAIGTINEPERDLVAFIYANSTQVVFISPNGELLARAKIEAPYRYFHSTKKMVKGELIPGLNTLDFYFEFDINKNYLYQMAFLFYIIFILFFYGLFVSADAIYREYWASKLLKSTAINKAPRGILLINQDGEILFYNSNIEKFFRIDLSSGKHKTFKSVFQDFIPIYEFIDSLLRMKSPASQEIAFLNGPHLFNGQIVGIPLKKVPLLQRMFYIEIEDFSEPLHVDRLRIWYDAVNKMVHDIKTPLATIGINLQLLRYKLKDLDLPEKEEKLKKFDIIEKELTRVREISREFLRFSNLSTPQFETIDLIKFIHKILKKMLPLYMDRVNLEFFPEEKELLVQGDPRLLELLFDILIENSVQAIDGNGRIQIYLKKNPEASTVTIHVEDNGHGMTAEEMERIFDPFFTTKEGGSGMGLVFAQKIVKDHGSVLKVKSEKGKGAIFYFDLFLE